MAKHLNIKCLYHTIIVTLSCSSHCCSGICRCGLLRSRKGGVRPFRDSLFESREGLPKTNKTWSCNATNSPSFPVETQFFQVFYFLHLLLGQGCFQCGARSHRKKNHLNPYPQCQQLIGQKLNCYSLLQREQSPLF